MHECMSCIHAWMHACTCVRVSVCVCVHLHVYATEDMKNSVFLYTQVRTELSRYISAHKSSRSDHGISAHIPQTQWHEAFLERLLPWRRLRHTEGHGTEEVPKLHQSPTQILRPERQSPPRRTSLPIVEIAARRNLVRPYKKTRTNNKPSIPQTTCEEPSAPHSSASYFRGLAV